MTVPSVAALLKTDNTGGLPPQEEEKIVVPELNQTLLNAYRITAEALRGRERRLFMAQIVRMLGEGGQRLVERELQWNRGTVRRGLRELDGTWEQEQGAERRGRKRIEVHLPQLMTDIGRLRREGPISTGQLRRLLVERCGYHPDGLPTRETLRKKLREAEKLWNI